MGKNKTKAKINFASLEEEKRKIDKKLKKVSIPCAHQNAKGKVKVETVNEDGTLVKCKICNAVFDIGKIHANELKQAIKVVHNAINQIKTLTEDQVAEENIIETLGQLDFSLSDIPELYERMYGKSSKKKKNKNKDHEDSYGFYGIQGMASNTRGGRKRY